MPNVNLHDPNDPLTRALWTAAGFDLDPLRQTVAKLTAAADTGADFVVTTQQVKAIARFIGVNISMVELVHVAFPKEIAAIRAYRSTMAPPSDDSEETP